MRPASGSKSWDELTVCGEGEIIHFRYSLLLGIGVFCYLLDGGLASDGDGCLDVVHPNI